MEFSKHHCDSSCQPESSRRKYRKEKKSRSPRGQYSPEVSSTHPATGHSQESLVAPSIANKSNDDSANLRQCDGLQPPQDLSSRSGLLQIREELKSIARTHGWLGWPLLDAYQPQVTDSELAEYYTPATASDFEENDLVFSLLFPPECQLSRRAESNQDENEGTHSDIDPTFPRFHSSAESGVPTEDLWTPGDIINIQQDGKFIFKNYEENSQDTPKDGELSLEDYEENGRDTPQEESENGIENDNSQSDELESSSQTSMLETINTLGVRILSLEADNFQLQNHLRAQVTALYQLFDPALSRSAIREGILTMMAETENVLQDELPTGSPATVEIDHDNHDSDFHANRVSSPAHGHEGERLRTAYVHEHNEEEEKEEYHPTFEPAFINVELPEELLQYYLPVGSRSYNHYRDCDCWR